MNTAFNKITQGKLEEWSEAYLNVPEEQRKSQGKDNGLVVRLAVQYGWFTKGEYAPSDNGTPESWSIDGVPVAEMEPVEVTRLARKANQIYNEAMTVPLASTSPPPPAERDGETLPTN